jgi:hypothetical protein
LNGIGVIRDDIFRDESMGCFLAYGFFETVDLVTIARFLWNGVCFGVKEDENLIFDELFKPLKPLSAEHLQPE